MEARDKAVLAQEAAARWRALTAKQRNQGLLAMAEKLRRSADVILEANEQDRELAQRRSISGALLDRLTLDSARIDAMAKGLEDVAAAADPLGEVVSGRLLENGLRLHRIRVPLGVIGMIYEARPNVTADAAGLCLKAGNVVLLRGGSEALRSNQAITSVLRSALQGLGLPMNAVQLIENTDRQEVVEMLKLNGLVDVIIPRGGASLIQTVVQNATVPVVETGVGNCHVYVDESANVEQGVAIVDNAKTQRPGVCNAAETLLVHKAVAKSFLPRLWQVLSPKGVRLRGCSQSQAILPHIERASAEDWQAEYLDLILAVRVVESLDQALEHIASYSTKHSEAIVTESYANSQRFLHAVDAAAVYVNASTRFTDGAEFGMGAEIGISTQKLHARGPMGLRELTTTKYLIYGDGTIRQ